MAEAETLGTAPEALDKRQRIVTLADGSTIVVHKWSNQKSPELLPLVGLLVHVPTLAEQSVSEADREKVRGLDFDDQLQISTAASELNATPRILKNLRTLLDQRKGLEEALTRKKDPSNPS